jgi:hypothetical protein
MTEPQVATDRQGSPFAAELDRRLAGDEPLVDVVNWWETAYTEWRMSQPLLSEDNPHVADLTEHEMAVFGIGIMREWVPEDEPLTEDNDDPYGRRFGTP